MHAETAGGAGGRAGARAARPAWSAAARNMLWLSVDKAVAVVLGLLVFGLIARALGPEGAGQFSYGVAVLQTALGLSLVCSSAAVLPRLCRLGNGAAAAAAANVFVARMLGSLVAASLVALYAWFTIDDTQRRLLTLVMLTSVPLIEPFLAFGAYWQSRNHNRPLFVARSGGLVARLLLVLLALWMGAEPWVIALAWVLEAAVAAVLQTRGIAAVRPWHSLLRAVSRVRTTTYLRFGVRFVVGLLLSHLFLRLDRLWLAERMSPHDFGLYATAMQLVDVWLHVALLMSGSIAPAFLYSALQRSSALRAHWRVVTGFALLGLAGLAGAWLVGPWILALVFGPQFSGSHPYLVAGFAAAVLFFVDQFVQIAITASDRPALLAMKWGTACAAAFAVLLAGTGQLGPYAGPAGIATGLVAGWLAVGLANLWGLRGPRAPAAPAARASHAPPPRAPVLVSVIINSYNYERYIGAAIDSALAQTYRPLEVIVVDDGSADGSWEVIRSYGERIVAQRQDNGGQGSAYNAGFALSRGEWVLFLDSDDLLDPQAVERCMAAAQPDTAKVQFTLRTIGPDGAPRGGVVPYLAHEGDVTHIVRRFALYAGPPASGNFYRRSAIERYLPMPTQPWRRGADTVPFVLCTLHGRVVSLREPLGSYRLHSPANNRSGVLGNVSRSMREALFQPAHVREALLAWAAQRTDFRFDECMLTLPGDWRLRALSWRLNRAEHPFTEDTRLSIWRGAAGSLRHLPGYTGVERLLQHAWLLFVLWAPRRWVHWAASSNVSGGLRARLKLLRRIGIA